MMSVILFLCINLVVDIVYCILDPRRSVGISHCRKSLQSSRLTTKAVRF